jgi:hypothetical protein
MIYLFTGTDESGVRAKAFAWVKAARTKAPDAYYLRLDAPAITEATLREALGAQGLFYQKSLVALDDPFSRAESRDAVLALLPELAASTNIVAIIAPKPSAKEAKALAEHAEKSFTVDAKPAPKRGFNGALVNALGSRNGSALWAELHRAYRAGDPPELVHGLLHWKARDLMQKGSSRDWSPDQARTLSRDLILLLSESRGRGLPLDLALERFALSLRAG